MSTMLEQLAAEFPREAVSWRAQSLTRDGTKAMALAYIDARDVMDRLDSVVGPANWQDRYEVHGPKTVCYLSIKIDGEWVTKADGAGDTAVEAEKGSISDAFKRAAVKWGIGRYLYALDAPWVPCESYENHGKRHWKRWTVDCWSCVKPPAKLPQARNASSAEQKRQLDEIERELLDCATVHAVNKCAEAWKNIAARDNWSKDFQTEAAKKFEARRKLVSEQAIRPGQNAYADAAMAG